MYFSVCYMTVQSYQSTQVMWSIITMLDVINYAYNNYSYRRAGYSISELVTAVHHYW